VSVRVRLIVASAVIAVAAGMLLAGCASTPAAPAGITAAQKSAATEANLAERWSLIAGQNPALEAPKVPIVRYTNYLDEPSTIATCLRRAGYPKVVVTNANDVVDRALTPPENYSFDVAKYVCEAKYPRDPLELGYLSDAQEAFLYSYWQDNTVPCLRAQGLRVNDLPPIGQFGEGYEDVGNMNPFGHLKIPAGLSLAVLQTRCQPYPGQLYGASASR
jgi:hypothetical protein